MVKSVLCLIYFLQNTIEFPILYPSRILRRKVRGGSSQKIAVEMYMAAENLKELINQERSNMKIAITAENSNGLDSTIAQHFGRAPFFILVDVERKEVTATEAISNPFAAKHEPGQVPDFIRDQGAKVMVSGGMGGRAIQFFEQAGIEVATGARGTVRQALENFLGGELQEAAPCAESVEHGHG